MIRAELHKSDHCEALGLSAVAEAPVLALCRLLVKAGHDASEPMEVYRGEQLALRIRSIGEAAKLTVREAPGDSAPRFVPFRARPEIG